MKLIVDTNCIVSALIKDALSRKIINGTGRLHNHPIDGTRTTEV